jgi:transcriptional regulator with XRE-family HTH domain
MPYYTLNLGVKKIREANMVDYVTIGKRVMQRRLRMGMSQKELAMRAGITTVYLSNVENAHSKASLPTFLKLANALDCGVDALIWDNYSENRQVFEDQLADLVSDCSPDELRIIVGTVIALKEQIRAVNTKHISRHRSFSSIHSD